MIAIPLIQLLTLNTVAFGLAVMSMQKAQQKATGFFHKAKLWTKEKLGKRGPEDPVVEAASKKFLESKVGPPVICNLCWVGAPPPLFVLVLLWASSERAR